MSSAVKEVRTRLAGRPHPRLTVPEDLTAAPAVPEDLTAVLEDPEETTGGPPGSEADQLLVYINDIGVIHKSQCDDHFLATAASTNLMSQGFEMKIGLRHIPNRSRLY